MQTLVDRAVYVVLVLALATTVALAVAYGVSVELVVAYVWLVALFAEWNDDWRGTGRAATAAVGLIARTVQMLPRIIDRARSALLGQ